ncbi:MAG: hypothetical protein DRH04_04420, partial [Deltaproteobacteria bacterium]
GETTAQLPITGLTGGNPVIHALINNTERASMTVTVRGGVVTGTALVESVPGQLDPVAGVEVNVNGQIAVTDADGFFLVEGIGSPAVTIRAFDPATSWKGYATGSMSAANGYLHDVILVLKAAETVTGTVVTQDGHTAAGAGVRVELFPAHHSSGLPLQSVFTNTDGRFEFPLVELGNYDLDATNLINGDRGRTRITVSSGQAVDTLITYLGRGNVRVTVLEEGSQPVANAELTLRSYSLFGSATTTALAQTDGTYIFTDIFLGDFTVTAEHPTTNTGGSISGSITTHEQLVEMTLQVGDWAALEGTVYRADGSTPVVGARVSVGGVGRTVTDTAGFYRFAILPLGTYQVNVTHESSRGIGSAAISLATTGATEELNINLLGQGTVVVTVEDADDLPAAGASISLTDSYTYHPMSGAADATGIAVFQPVNEGTFHVSASANGLDGEADGTLTAGEVFTITVHLEPSGAISGTVYQPDGVTPVENAQVRLLGDSGWLTPVITTADGRFLFDGLPLFTHYGNPIHYRLESYEGGTVSANGSYVGGQLRAQISDIIITSNGQTVTRDLILVGLGTVDGQILMPDSSAAGDTSVTVRSLTPIFNKTWSLTTDANGNYTVERVPVGNFIVTSGNIADQLWGEGEGEIIDDGDIITVDIVLESNAITLPRNIYDANHFRFDLQENGNIKYGQNVFQPIESLGITGAATLAVVENSVEYPFVGGEIPVEEDFGRETVVRQLGLAGLNVTRKVYVPLEGYFARYLEIFSNPTAEDITVDVLVKTAFRDSNTFITATSSGDDQIQPAGAETQDYWAALDDDGTGDPFLATRYNYAPVAFVWGGPDATLEPDAVEFMPYAYPIYANVISTWNSVSIPAGESVAIMHFISQQTSRNGAAASAQRLVQLPPEALQGLSLSEIETIQNFAVPEGGTSELDVLPPMNAQVSGQVLASDETTIGYPGCTVSLKSSHPLFGRTYQVSTNTSGNFEFIPDPVTNPVYAPIIGIPVGDLTLSARIYTDYPQASYSPEIPCSYPEGTHALSQNIIFSNTGIFEGVVRKATGEVISGATVDADLIIDESPYYENRGEQNSIADGSYCIAFLPPGEYTLTVSVPHSQGYNSKAMTTGTIIEGQTTPLDITMPPQGDITGVVTGPDGNPVINALVQLRETEGDYFRRETRTDTSGRYLLTDIPVGTYSLTAFDPATNGPLATIVMVNAEETLTTDFPLPSFTTLPANLTDGDGFLWDVQTDGRIYHGTDNAYTNGLDLIVGTNGFSTFTTAVTEENGLELLIGPYNYPALDAVTIRRKVFVPADDGFARYLEMVENRGAEEVTVQLNIRTYLGSGSNTQVLATTSGDTAFNAWDSYIVTDDNGDDGSGSPAMVHVVSGDYAEVKPTTITMNYGYYIVTTYDVTVPAGERRIIMHFASQNIDRASAMSRAEQLRHLDGAALTGLSADEQADIINFVAYPDSDNDGLTDEQEMLQGTDSTIPDTDSDGLLDGFEVAYGYNPRADLGEGGLDPDHDGLDNLGEQNAMTDPFISDTDGGGQLDGAEVNDVGTDPLNADDDLLDLPLNLYDANAFLWDVQRNGRIYHGTDNAYYNYSGGFALTVNSSLFPSFTTALPENGGRELTIGSQSNGDLLVDRKVFVPEDDAFIRYLEILENTNATEPVTTTVQINSYLGSSNSTQVITTSTGDQHFNAVDDYIVTDDNNDGTGTPTMVHVFSGAYAEVEP